MNIHASTRDLAGVVQTIPNIHNTIAESIFMQHYIDNIYVKIHLIWIFLGFHSFWEN